MIKRDIEAVLRGLLRGFPVVTLTGRLRQRVEQELTEYCARRRLTKSEAMKLALEELLLHMRRGRPI